MPHRKAKKPRGSRGATPCIRDGRQRQYHDLMVLLPKSSVAPEEKIQALLLLEQVVDRLVSIGYTSAALTHIVYGRPRTEEDSPDSVMQLPSFKSPNRAKEHLKQRNLESHSRKRREWEGNLPIRIVGRMHAVVENLSDVGMYTGTRTTENAATLDLLQQYDLVSLVPRNDATFQAACRASEVDIVTLDYTAGRGGVQLPFRIGAADVRAVVERGAAFELHYAPAVLHMNQRKALVQTARALHMARVGVRPKPRLLFSSGDRAVGGSDQGAMALRAPGDLINLLQTVLGWDASTARDALVEFATKILERGRLRRLGRLGSSERVEAYLDGQYLVDETGTIAKLPASGGDEGKSRQQKHVKPVHERVRREQNEGDEALDDGFVMLS